MNVLGAPISSFYSLLDHQAGFLVINKAPGVAVQGDAGAPSVLEHIRRDLQLSQLFPVHRLDMGTSGLVVAATTSEANRELSQAFQNQQVCKCYLAISGKKPTKKQGWVIGDMEKARGGNYRLSRTRENPSRTAFRSFALDSGKRLFVLRPLTGKTHQLRVALKSLGAPIIGDERYGGEESDRMYLHAWRLEFSCAGKAYRYIAAPDRGALFSLTSLHPLLTQLGENDTWRLGV